jgi:hypothetical protein
MAETQELSDMNGASLVVTEIDLMKVVVQSVNRAFRYWEAEALARF